MNYATEHRAALEAVSQACILCEAVRVESGPARSLAGLGKALSKSDKSPVTLADFGAQAVISRRLHQQFPDVPLVGEESADLLRADSAAELRGQVVSRVQAVLSLAELGQAGMDEEDILAAIDRGGHPGGSRGRFWVVDPIDGTKGFLRGEQYAVALALIDQGQVVLGVLGCPRMPRDPGHPWPSPGRPDAGRGCLFAAVRGHGATVQALAGGDPATPGQDRAGIHVSPIDNPSDAILCESVEPGHSSHTESARIAALLGLHRPPHRIDSQCKYAAIARGEATVYLRLPSRRAYAHQIWDHAAGAIVVEEAGGRVSGVDGEPLDFSLGATLARNRGMVVTNGRVHEAVLSAVRQVLAPP
jgi:3'(2'), 5'-bisphosphate nucleotidase